MAFLATSTTSADSSSSGPFLRKTSLISRFARFLETAPPTFLLATKPTRNPPRVVTKTKATKRGLTHRRPSRYTRSKSALPRSVGVVRDLFRNGSPSNRDSVPPLASAASEDGSAGLRSHSHAKAMGPAASASIRLECSLHFVKAPDSQRCGPITAALALRSIPVEAKLNILLLPFLSVNPTSTLAPPPLAPRTRRPPRIFSCRPQSHMLDYRPRPVDIDEKAFPNEVGVPRDAGFPHLLIFLWKSSRRSATVPAA